MAAGGGLGGAMAGLSLGGPAAGAIHGHGKEADDKHPVECRQTSVVIEGVPTEIVFSK